MFRVGTNESESHKRRGVSARKFDFSVNLANHFVEVREILKDVLVLKSSLSSENASSDWSL